jgi:hypothetical protein
MNGKYCTSLCIIIAAIFLSGCGKDDASKKIIKEIDDAINHIRSVTITTEDYPWTVMHGILAYGNEYKIKNTQSGIMVNALDYIAAVGAKEYFRMTGDRPATVSRTPGTLPFRIEDHVDQWLYILLQANVSSSQSFCLPDKSFTCEELLNASQHNASTYTELPWTIAAYSIHLDRREEWFNKYNQKINIDILADALVNSDWTASPCNGAHHLYALALVRNKKMVSRSLRREIDSILSNAACIAMKNQNSDGTWGSRWVSSKEDPVDSFEAIHLLGHQMEWLSMWLDEDQLMEEWVSMSISTLARKVREFNVQAIERESTNNPEYYGFLCHAVKALKQYKNRIQKY